MIFSMRPLFQHVPLLGLFFVFTNTWREICYFFLNLPLSCSPSLMTLLLLNCFPIDPISKHTHTRNGFRHKFRCDTILFITKRFYINNGVLELETQLSRWDHLLGKQGPECESNIHIKHWEDLMCTCHSAIWETDRIARSLVATILPPVALRYLKG